MLKEEQKLSPNPAAIEAHLRHITRRWGELDCKVNLEVVFLTAEDNAKVKHSARFSHDDTGISLAVDHIVGMNRPGINAYATVNPVRAEAQIGSGKRSSKEHIAASFFQWADSDSPEAADNIRNFVGPKCTFFVMTGTTPGPRPHVYWELEKPETDLEAWSSRQSAIVAALGTDNVTDPPRIMRLAGTVNWPKPQKAAKGYIPELTTIRIYDPKDRPAVSAEQLARAFGSAPRKAKEKPARERLDFSDDGAPEAGEVLELLSYISPDCGYADWLAVLMGLHDKFNGSEEGFIIADNWSAGGAKYVPGEVSSKWHSFTPGGGTSFKTVAELAKQNGADLSAIARKYKCGPQSDPFADFQDAAAHDDWPDDSPPPPPAWPSPFNMFDEAAIEARQWLYGRHYLRRFVSVLASAGGVGKTSMQIVEALAMVTGRPLLGEEVHAPCKVWLINLEDPMDEMQRRILAAMNFYGIKPEEVRGRLFVDAGREFSLTFAVQTREGVTPNKKLVEYLIKRIPELDIGAVFIDPFVGAHMINENDNMAVNAVFAEIRKVADLTNCAFGLVHHIRKGNGEEATIDSVRGAGSLISAARAARIVNKVTIEAAASLGIDAKTAAGLFRVDDGKANLAPPAVNAVFRRMEGLQIANGDWVGVATPFTLPDEWGGMDDETVNEMLRMMDIGIADPDGNEEYYSLRPQDKERWVGNIILTYPFDNPDHTKNIGQAKKILQTWQKNGLLEEFEYRSAKQRKDRKGVRSTGRVGEQK